MTSPSDIHEEWYVKAMARSRRHVEGNRKRIRRKQREQERERLTRLGVDPAWLERVLGDMST